VSKASRVKGHSFENTIKNMINRELENYHLPYSLERNLNQTRDGGADLVGLDNFQIECKRYAKQANDLPRNEWWKQVCDVCEERQEIPILIYKYDYQDIQVQFPVMMFNFVDESYDVEFSEYPARMHFDQFIYLFIGFIKARSDV